MRSLPTIYKNLSPDFVEAGEFFQKTLSPLLPFPSQSNVRNLKQITHLPAQLQNDMEIIYATNFDSQNIHCWSGLGVYYHKMLKSTGFTIQSLENLRVQYELLYKLKYKLLNSVQSKVNLPRFSTKVANHFASIIEQNAQPGSCIFSPNTIVLAEVSNRYKKVLYADATLECMLNFYASFSNLADTAITEGHKIEKKAIQNADLLIYTSHWAANSAIQHYKADPKKVFVVPFGANLSMLPEHQEVDKLITQKKFDTLKLLFIGVDWKRKGGDYALQVAEQLIKAGRKVELHVVGIQKLPAYATKGFVINHGFISKHTKEGNEKFYSLLSNSHFLLLPTLADCTPVAFSEANAFGVPCIASKVGGNESIIQDNINGHLFSLSDYVSNATAFISDSIASQAKYQELGYSSFNYYLENLNWNVIGKKISGLMQNI